LALFFAAGTFNLGASPFKPGTIPYPTRKAFLHLCCLFIPPGRSLARKLKAIHFMLPTFFSPFGLPFFLFVAFPYSCNLLVLVLEAGDQLFERRGMLRQTLVPHTCLLILIRYHDMPPYVSRRFACSLYSLATYTGCFPPRHSTTLFKLIKPPVLCHVVLAFTRPQTYGLVHTHSAAYARSGVTNTTEKMFFWI
jgi:hypothetical protein